MLAERNDPDNEHHGSSPASLPSAETVPELPSITIVVPAVCKKPSMPCCGHTESTEARNSRIAKRKGSNGSQVPAAQRASEL